MWDESKVMSGPRLVEDAIVTWVNCNFHLSKESGHVDKVNTIRHGFSCMFTKPCGSTVARVLPE